MYLPYSYFLFPCTEQTYICTLYIHACGYPCLVMPYTVRYMVVCTCFTLCGKEYGVCRWPGDQTTCYCMYVCMYYSIRCPAFEVVCMPGSLMDGAWYMCAYCCRCCHKHVLSDVNRMDVHMYSSSYVVCTIYGVQWTVLLEREV